MLTKLRTGFYPSAFHRVICNHDKVGPRYSIPYFVVPEPDAIVKPQPSRIAVDGEKMYEPVTFMEYSTKMFETVNVYD
jgi:isopenicillin N synthase-like dioxygenase